MIKPPADTPAVNRISPSALLIPPKKHSQILAVFLLSTQLLWAKAKAQVAQFQTPHTWAFLRASAVGIGISLLPTLYGDPITLAQLTVSPLCAAVTLLTLRHFPNFPTYCAWAFVTAG